MMWYENKIGQTVDYIRSIPEGYLSREDDGYTNIVLKEDAEIVSVECTNKKATVIE